MVLRLVLATLVWGVLSECMQAQDLPSLRTELQVCDANEIEENCMDVLPCVPTANEHTLAVHRHRPLPLHAPVPELLVPPPRQ